MTKLTELRDQICNLAESENSLAILSHSNPDGDGFCASLALQKLLRHWGKASVIVVDNLELSSYAHLMSDADLEIYSAESSYSDLIILDCNSLDRLGAREALVTIASRIVLIDHHLIEHRLIPSNFSLIEPAFVSVGAIIFRALYDDISRMPDAIRIDIVNSLYTTILNDTNNFTNANTNAEVFETSGMMCKLGINPSRLYKDYFLNQSPEEMRYTGEVLSTIELALNRKILIMHSTLEMLNRNGLKPDDVMNITRFVQGVRGLEAIVYLREESDKLFKISLRSPHLDVNKIATTFGGGGHRSASGAHARGTMEDIKQHLLSLFEEALREIEQNA